MIQPRNAALERAYDPVRFWSELTVVERHNVTGTAQGAWSITGLNEGLTGLLAPGGGVILFEDGVEVLSGPVTAIQRGGSVSTVSGISDTDMPLRGRIIFPDPTKPITQQPTAYDNRSGPAETVLLGYINANAGPGALASRRVRNLRVPTSQGRGKKSTISGRLGILADTVADLAEAGGLHVDIIHAEDAAPYLQTRVRLVTDRSADIRFGTANSFIGAVVNDDWSYTLSMPTTTDAIVAGGGQGVNRIFVEQTSPAAEAAWGMKVETLIDQRQTTDLDELTDAATDAITDGASPVTVSFTVSPSNDLQYRRDWNVGDRVGVVLDGLDLTDVVREVTTTVQVQEGSPTQTVRAVIGSRDSSNWTTKQNTDVAKALTALQRLQAI
ncbi:Gp37-like protein [Microbacterium sp. M1A1_1b]